jgi:hypothetical protein
MNFKQYFLKESEQQDLAEEGDYISLLKDNTLPTADWSELDVSFKAGTIFEVIYLDEDDMGCWYVTPLVNGVPGNYVDRDVEYIIGLSQIENVKCIDKRSYEIKHTLTSQTKETFGDLIDEL